MSTEGKDLANSANQLQSSAQNILDIINKQQDVTVIQALLELLKIYDIPITIAGDKYIISNLENITEYPNVQYTKTMVKNETWRKSVAEVFHLESIDKEKLIGFMDMQFILKMRSHKRKGAHEYINGIKRESANAEIIPNRQRTRTFFGMR